MDNAQPNLKKIAFLVVGGILVIFLFSWLWRYYHTGKIIITTGNTHNTIVLTKTSDGGSQSTKQRFKAHGKLSVTVGTGKYVASVTGNSIATTQAIDLKPRATLRYTINPINATGVEPVAYKNAQAITATANQLVYLDGYTGKLSKINSQNNLKEDVSAQQFQTVQWASSSFGLGRGTDGSLYTIINGSVSLLKVPFYYGDKPVNFSVSPDKRIYVSNGADVYARSQKGSFKKIYTASSSSPALAAGVHEVAVSDSKYGDKPSDIPKSLLAIISVSGKVTKKNVEAERLAWSPNGQYLATVNQARPTIYDATLHQVAVVPANSVVGQFEWLNNATLLYTSSSELWTYNLSQQKAQLLANTPLGDSITGLYISDDRSYVYVTTVASSSQVYAIRRIGLKGRKVPDYIYSLQNALPLSQNGYSLSLINFSGSPTILVQVAPGVSAAAQPQQAIKQLQGLGFDTGKLRFDVERVEP